MSYRMILASALGATLCTSQALAIDYKCQLVSVPDLYYADVDWNGEAPASWQFRHEGRRADVRIGAIGLAGHPEYLFEFRVGERTVLSSSQKANLTDYNLNWRSAAPGEDDVLISFACRERDSR